MTVVHHVVSRLAPLVMGFWAGGGLIVLSYLASRGEKGAKLPTRVPTEHFAGTLLRPAELRIQAPPFAPINSFQPSGFNASPSTSAAHMLRSASVLRMNHPPEPGLVSVVIPTYNRAPIIGAAIDSALGQTYSNLEVVIADDGSSDDTQAIVESYGPRVTYVRQKNAGVSAARNLGMRHARGEFIAFLDSDDTWCSWKIEAEVAALQLCRSAGIVWTDMKAVDDMGDLVAARYLRRMYTAYAKVDIERTLRHVCVLGALSPNAPREFASADVRHGDLFSAIMLGNLIHTSTVLFRRAWLERTGGFDESFSRAGEDYEFYIRLCSAGSAVFIDAPTAIYRVGADDQLTRPAMALEIANNNLRAVEKWIPASAPELELPREQLRRRFAESFAWVGQAELDAGHRWQAVRRLSRSLAMMPRLDRRAILLVKCAVPDSALHGFRAVRRALHASPPPVATG